ncbi:MAG: methyltransferase, partial [Nocardioides sp.]
MGSETIADALARIEAHLLDPTTLVRAVGAGRRRGGSVLAPRWRKVELRYVDLAAERRLQVTTYDETQAHIANHPVGEAAREAVRVVLSEAFANWHLETVTTTHQVRITKKGRAISHLAEVQRPEPERRHDKPKARLLAADDPVLVGLGISTAEGRIKPSAQAKYRQVEEFLRLLDAALADGLAAGHLRRPSQEAPLRIVDLGCGNAYLTFAAQRFLSHVRGLPVQLTGVDVKTQSREHNVRLASALGLDAEFVLGAIGEVVLPHSPEVVLALHACDTATDEALARAVGWQ